MALTGGGQSISRSYRFGVLINVVVICLLAVALMVGVMTFVGHLSEKHDLRWDFTRDSRYELDPLAKKLLRENESNLRVTLLYGIDTNLRRLLADSRGSFRSDLANTYYFPMLEAIASQVRRVCIEWQKTQERIRFDVLPVRGSTAAQCRLVADELGTTVGGLLNKVVVSMSGRRREISMMRLVDMDWGRYSPAVQRMQRLPFIRGSWRVQAELTNALRGLSFGATTSIGIPTGLNSYLEPGSSEFRALRDLLTGQGYTVKALKLAGQRRVPADVDVLFLPAVGVRLPPSRLRLLVDFEKRGGRMVIVVDPKRPETFKKLLEPYGVTILDVQIQDDANSLAREGRRELLHSNALCVPQSAIAGPLQRRYPLHLGASRALSVGRDRVIGVKVTPTLMGSDQARAVPIEFQSRTRRMLLAHGREHPLPHPILGIEASREVDVKGKQARLVVLAAAEVLNPGALNDAGLANADLLINTLSWLSDRPAAIDISPRDDRMVRVDPVSRAFNPAFWVGVVAFPGLALMLAAVCFFLRRR